ncbi:hypothetical protein FOMPIDRAFT_1048348, partial [Fomitopsis schrenkii]
MANLTANQALDFGELTESINACMRRECRIAWRQHTGDMDQPPEALTRLAVASEDRNLAHRLNPVLIGECSFMANMIIHAMTNPIDVDYDAERHAWRLHQFEGKEAGAYTDPLLSYTSPRYVEGQMTPFTYPAPTMVRDIHKKVLLWSLPGILLPARQRKMQAATAGITRQFEQYAPQPSSRTWQRRPEQFVPTESGIPPLGTPAFSPGCFESGTA